MNTRTTALLVGVLVISAAAGIGIGWGIASTTSSSGGTAKSIQLSMVVEGHSGGILGSDNKTHDTMMPENLTVYAGQQVTLTVLNFDEGPHTITNAALNLDLMIPGRTAPGQPSSTTFHFALNTPGTYFWYCRLPCDAGQGGWAMLPFAGNPVHAGFMGGYITVLAK